MLHATATQTDNFVDELCTRLVPAGVRQRGYREEDSGRRRDHSWWHPAMTKGRLLCDSLHNNSPTARAALAHRILEITTVARQGMTRSGQCLRRHPHPLRSACPINKIGGRPAIVMEATTAASFCHIDAPIVRSLPKRL